MSDIMNRLKKLADMLKSSNHALALTGAAIFSDNEDRDDYNSANRLWTMVSPDDFTIGRFKEDPENFYDSGAPYFSLLYQSKPNAVHSVLAKLEEQGYIKALITQNIDGLHKLAGSKKVYEIHGSLRTATCTHCQKKISADEFLDESGECAFPLRCSLCGEILKPDIALPGEALPEDFDLAIDEAQKADLIILIGAPMFLAPDNKIPEGCESIIVINSDKSYYDDRASLLIREKPSKVMELLMEELNI